MNTKQSQEEVLQTARLFLEYILPTKFFLINESTQTPEQNKTAQINSILFCHWLEENKADDNGVVDFTVQNLKEAYKCLRDAKLIKFEVAPKLHQKIVYDERGNQIKDLLGGRKRRQEQEAREAEEAKNKSNSLIEQARKAEMNVHANKGIEDLRARIASFRGRSHGATAKARAEMNEVIDKLTKSGKRHLSDVLTAKSDIEVIENKYWS